MNRLLSVTAASIILAVSALHVSPVAAQDNVVIQDLEIGNQIEIRYAGNWLPAIVVEVVGTRMIKAEFSNPLTGKAQTFAFPISHVRYADVPDVPDVPQIDYPTTPRTWKSSNGKFSVEATIESIANGKIKLKRPDSNVIELPIDKLSADDQDFLKSLKEDANPFSNIVDGPAKPPTQPKRSRVASGRRVIDPNARFVLTDPDTDSATKITLPNFIPWSFEAVADSPRNKMAVPGVVSGIPAFSRLRKIKMVDGKPIVLASVGGHMKQTGNLVLMDAKTGRQIANFKIPMDDMQIADISPNGKLAATISTKHDNNRVDIWELTETELKHVIGWQVPNGGGMFSNVTEAVFVGNETLVTADKKKNLFVWDVENAKLVFKKQVAPFGPKSMSVTRDGKRLVYSGEQRINVLNVESGEIEGAVEFPFGGKGIAISQNGKSAACMGRTVSVWDSNGQKNKEFILPTMFNPEHCQWFNEQMLLVSSGSRVFAIDTENRVVLARYEFENGNCFLDESGAVWNLSLGRGQARMGSVRIDPTRFIDRLPVQGDGLLMFRKGQTVRLEIDLPFKEAELKEIRRHFANELAGLEVELVDGPADITIRMTSQKQKPKVVETEDIIPRLPMRGFFRRSTSSATVNATTFKLEYLQGDRVFWQKNAKSGPGPLIRQKDGENLQDAVDRLSKPTPRFFLTEKIPGNLAMHPPEGAYAIVKIGLDGVKSEVFPGGKEPELTDF